MRYLPAILNVLAGLSLAGVYALLIWQAGKPLHDRMDKLKRDPLYTPPRRLTK
jgi:hypothetical protein